MGDCIFCKIVAGEIPSIKVYEDDHLLGFMDINPVTPGHSLLIPKAHHATLFDMPDDLLGELLTAARGLGRAIQTGMGARGLNLLQSNGRAANQIIDHFHLHLVPRYEADEIPMANWEMTPGDIDGIKGQAEKIKQSF